MVRRDLTLYGLLKAAEEHHLPRQIVDPLSWIVIGQQSLRGREIPQELAHIEPPPGAGHGAYAG